MKQLVFITLLSVTSLFCFAQTEFDNRENISGLWSDVNTSDFENTYMIIAQDGDEIFIAHYLEWKKQPEVEYGQGKRIGDNISYDVIVTRPIKGWATRGTHSLKLSKDGNELTGEYRTDTGLSGPLRFKRIGK